MSIMTMPELGLKTGFSKRIPKWFLAKWLFGGLGYQGQTKRHMFRKIGFVLAAEGGKAQKPLFS